MTPKQKVLRKYPDATVVKYGWGYMVWTGLHFLGADTTELKAWADAAKRLK